MISKFVRGVVSALLAIPFLIAISPPASADVAPDPIPVPVDGVDYFPYSVIYVEDNTTSGLWPIAGAVAEWDAGTNVSIRLGKCQPNAGCVLLTEEVQDPRYAGVSWNDNVLNNVFQGQSHTIFNLGWGQGAAIQLRTQVTCHELGHDLGIEYHWFDLSANSCLYYAADEGAATVPNAYDKQRLNEVYTAPPPTAPAPVPPVSAPPATFHPHPMTARERYIAWQVQRLINRQRARHHMPWLTMGNAPLRRYIARRDDEYMAAHNRLIFHAGEDVAVTRTITLAGALGRERAFSTNYILNRHFHKVGVDIFIYHNKLWMTADFSRMS